MFQIDSDAVSATLPPPASVGPTVGYFTKGDPGNAIPATVVSDDWLNMVQEELANVVLAAGLTLSKTTYDQVLTAIRALSKQDGTELALNNNASNVALTGFTYDGADLRTVAIDYALYRKDDAPTEVAAKGSLVLVYKPIADTWDLLNEAEVGDDCGVTFDVLQTGTSVQLRYSTTNLAGANYVGEIRLKEKIFLD